LSRGFFLSYRLGLLRSNHLYKYPYFLPRVIQRDDVVIDIGANLGYFTVLLSRWVGPKGHVHAVEPVEVILRVLRRNADHLRNVTIHPYALGPRDAEIQLGNQTRQHTGFMASGSNFVLEKAPETEEIDLFPAQMRRPQGLFADFTRLDFMKIDIEGYEVALLPELTALIQQHRPMLLIESRYDNRKEIISQLTALGMQGYVLEGEQLIPVAALPASQEDMLFVFPRHQERIGAFVAADK
jgi:FkbM family methyltransferase